MQSYVCLESEIVSVFNFELCISEHIDPGRCFAPGHKMQLLLCPDSVQTANALTKSTI